MLSLCVTHIYELLEKQRLIEVLKINVKFGTRNLKTFTQKFYYEGNLYSVSNRALLKASKL